MRNKFNTKAVYSRFIVSGNVIEKYTYQKPIIKGCGRKRKGRANSLFTSKEDKANNRKKVAQRARQFLRQVVNANSHLNKFLTLTYAENVQDIEKARKDFDKFIKRLKYHCLKKLEYVVVIEFQERGAIHFHLLCNLPYVEAKEIAELWRYGFIKINRIDNVDNVGAYITKYMSKDNIDERLIGKKCYSMSKGLKKPIEITDVEEIEEIEANLESVKRVYTTEFESEYYGKVEYTQIVCSSPIQLPTNFEKWLSRFKGRLTYVPDNTPTPFSV